MKNIKQNELITIIQCSKLCGFNHKRLSKFRKRIPGFPCPKNESKRRNMPHLFDKKEFLKFQEKNNIHELVMDLEREALREQKYKEEYGKEINEYGYLHYRPQPWPTLNQRAGIDQKTMVKFLCGRMY